MLLLLQLIAYMLAYNDTDLCQVCETPLVQNPHVAAHAKKKKKNRRFILVDWSSEKMIRGLPKNSFVSGTYIQVCINDALYI